MSDDGASRGDSHRLLIVPLIFHMPPRTLTTFIASRTKWTTMAGKTRWTNTITTRIANEPMTFVRQGSVTTLTSY